MVVITDWLENKRDSVTGLVTAFVAEIENAEGELHGDLVEVEVTMDHGGL